MEKNFTEILKAKEEQTAKLDKEEQMHLDDAARVKIISPGRLVAKRFMRNRLAIVGSVILIIMFVFSFLCPLFYGWGQTETDYKYDTISRDYALAKENKEYQSYRINDAQVDTSVFNRMNSYISDMEAKGETMKIVSDSEGNFYSVNQLADRIYSLNSLPATKICMFGSYTTYIGRFSTLGSKME